MNRTDVENAIPPLETIWSSSSPVQTSIPCHRSGLLSYYKFRKILNYLSANLPSHLSRGLP
jgi:hypothetical protein